MANPRVLISTDLGGPDNDDAQSMIHALLYANDLDYRGFVMTRTLDGGRVNGVRTSGAEMLREMLDAYDDDLASLRSHDASYPTSASLRAKIAEGSYSGAWPGTLSAGARLMITEGRAASPDDPLYLLGWGPIHDIAAAVLAAPDIVPNIRIFSLSGIGQDPGNTAAYDALVNAVSTRAAYKDLWWINAENSMRGIYLDKNGARIPGIEANLPWVLENVADHGALGELFHNKYTYDLSTTRTGPSSPDGLKMGDTPSLLYLIDAVDNDNPRGDSWGGSFQKWSIGTNTWVDRTDASLKMGNFPGARTVYKHREEIYGDFEERMDWADGPDLGTGPKIGLGRTEAESLTLAGYRLAGARADSSGQTIETFYSKGGHGTAKGTFTGPSGDYAMSVRFFNENDGASTFKVYVDDELAFTWRGTGGNNSFQTVTDVVHIDRGDVITIDGTFQAGEWARWDYLTVQSVTSAASTDAFDFL
ncbi:MAG: hypothetical protein DI556_03890 [Rhodovulum sulfidophilum]|uniref:Cellulose-binding Sde182 nucleoside hydrolase-like domain-containing protein n=1 Tax=Rhodovulum sulfidophilum TaxID=35806 RepID=A0A2W5QIH1_RHOSU|nr:MAG: hypothetical protein DI556_03890 [Rhodovulum sulfidophilum]